MAIPPQGKLTLKGRVERVRYSSPETGYTVLKVRPRRGGAFYAVGHVSEVVSGAGLEGAECSFTGRWELTRYGRQFLFDQYEIEGSDLLFFLSRVVKGLGPTLAQELIQRFGEEELARILDQEPERLLTVKGIKEKRLARIKKSWQKHKGLKALAEYLGRHGGITPSLLIRIYNHFGGDAVKTIQEDPYRLTEVRGIGFKTADRIALSLGLAPDSPERIKAAVGHCLLKAAEEEGHCYLPREQLFQQVEEALALDQEARPAQGEGAPGLEALLSQAVEAMVLSGDLASGPQGGELGLSTFKYMESWLMAFFGERSREGPRRVVEPERVREFLREFEERSGMELAPEQRRICEMVASHPASCFALAGYAGTGKTTVCRVILELLTRFLVEREEVVCCAFTGMASARVRKATGFDSFTIHSLLGYKGEGQFEYGPDRPLPHRVVLLDEASMVNLPLFYRLARALRPDALFIMVGDPAQLPPIGAGNVFADLLAHDLVPSVHLTRIFRQSQESVLALFANEIRQGKVPQGAEEEGWSDFRLEIRERYNIYALKRDHSERELKEFREKNNLAIRDRIIGLAREYKERLTHPSWEFQVLTPMRVGILGTEVLNHELQEVLNPEPRASFQRRGIRLKERDKVVHLQNRDMEVMEWQAFQEGGREFSGGLFRRVFNGNVGMVVKIDQELEQFYVAYPDRTVVAYDFDHLGDLVELAYAMTVHKAQGSQYRIVVIPLTNSHFIMLNNKWFYTAITRAEERCYIVGQRYAFKRACTNTQSAKRFTWMDLMAGAGGKGAPPSGRREEE